MIKATEVRIGNMVMLLHEANKPVYPILEIRENSIIFGKSYESGTGYCEFKVCDPIPLSPEWLQRCGFEKDRNGWYKPNSQFSLTDNLFPCWLDRMLWPGGVPDFHNVELKHLHQLQNLYYALTGEELSITPPLP